MVSENDLKELGFTTIGEYFNYIIDCCINGTGTWKELVKNLSKEQRVGLYKHLYYYESSYCYQLTMYMLNL